MSGLPAVLVCAACGATSGVFYDAMFVLRRAACLVFAKNSLPARISTLVCDILYFTFLTAYFLFLSYICNFNGIRAYMFVALAAGIVIYLKSLHVIVAFFVNKVYNKIDEKYKKGSSVCKTKKSAKE